jgi:hypothetical protein
MSTSSRIAWLAGAVAVASLLAACGSAQSSQPATTPSQSPSQSSQPGQPSTSAPASAPSSTPTASSAPAAPSTTPSGGTALAACSTTQLVITVDDTQADGTAGSVYYPLNFTNTASTACEMYGFPGVSFAAGASATASQIGQAADRAGGFTKVAVQLAPGGTAHAWVKVAAAQNYPASLCQPVSAGWLRVYPPGETVAGYVGHAFSACSSKGVTQLTVLPVRSGLGLAGVTP